ncbi:MAG: ribonuclease Z [Desulfuromonadales bacterium]|nr:ribonuclease Z [Desulfuromonadales bacterium]
MRSVFFPRLVNGPFGDPALYVHLAHRGEALLFDCGDLHSLAPREILRLQSIFISHAHIDHLCGFDLLLRHFLYRDRPLRLCGPPGLIDRLEHKLAGYTWNLVEGYPLELVVAEWGEPQGRQALFRAARGFRREEETAISFPQGAMLATPDFRVRAVSLEHGDIPSLAYALEETLHVAIHKDALAAFGYRPGPWLTRFKELVRRPASSEQPVRVPLVGGGEACRPLGELVATIAHLERGMKIVYVTDASPSEENAEKIVALAADAHLLAIEATFADQDLDRARTRNHLTARLAGELARRAGAARLLVFHHSPRYQDQPQRLGEEALQAFQATGEPGGG